MPLSKIKYNSLNVTPAASENIGFNAGANALATQAAGGSNTPNFSLKNAANQAITHATNTQVTLGTEEWDTGGDCASGAFTAPSAGKYLFTYGGCVAVSLDGAYTCFYLYKNGTLVPHTNLGSTSGSTEQEQLRGSLMLDLSASDVITLYVYWYDSGASGTKNATENCRLQGLKLA